MGERERERERENSKYKQNEISWHEKQANLWSTQLGRHKLVVEQ